MQLLRRLHLYLGCLFAPALIFFAVTGSWQLYRAHDSKKDHSYTAPAVLRTLSAVHMNAHLPGKRASDYTPLRVFMVSAAAGWLRPRSWESSWPSSLREACSRRLYASAQGS
jgi:hypothetical protein